MSTQVAIVGGGTMATALITAALTSGIWRPEDIAVAEPNDEARAKLAGKGCQTYASCTALPAAQAYLLCVKPQDLQQACAELCTSGYLNSQPVISIAAGVTTESLRDWLSALDIVRVMPNTPAVIGEGCSFAYAAQDTAGPAAKLTTRLMSACGSLFWVTEENLIDVATALSGSGPAYAYLVMEIMSSTAEQLGLPADIALAATAQTLHGASKMVMSADKHPAALREQVTSKGGTTAAALNTLADHKFAEIFADAIRAAHQRAEELAQK